MPNPEWGTKRVCQSCGAKFYDFGRAPIVCPNCGTVFDLEVLTRARRSRPARSSAAVVADEDNTDANPTETAEAETEAGETEDLVEEDEEAESADEADSGEDEEDESLIEDASELGEDDEELGDVIEGDHEGEENR